MVWLKRLSTAFSKGREHIFIPKPILGELLTVLATKFSRDREELARMAVWLSEVAQFVTPKRKIAVFSDDPDNSILECAVEAKADIIVTGDKKMLELVKFEDIRIVTLRRYLIESEH